MNFTKMPKINSKANIFGIWVLRSGASEIIQNYEKVFPALILNHIIANKARDKEDSFILLYQCLENSKIVVNHVNCKYLWELYK